MDITSQIEKIKSISLLENDNQIVEFEQIIEEIMQYGEKEHISLLCGVFNDDTKNHEVMFGLIHAIEAYDGIVGEEQSLEEVANAVVAMDIKAKEWSMILHKRILNNKPSASLYANIIKVSSEEIKSRVLTLMKDISFDNPNKFSESTKVFVDTVMS